MIGMADKEMDKMIDMNIKDFQVVLRSYACNRLSPKIDKDKKYTLKEMHEIMAYIMMFKASNKLMVISHDLDVPSVDLETFNNEVEFYNLAIEAMMETMKKGD